LGTGTVVQNDFKTILQTTVNHLSSRPVIWAALKRDEVKRLALDSLDPDPVQMIEDDLKVESKENSELLTVLYAHSDPVIAKTVAQGIKEAYLSGWVRTEQERRAETVSKLGKALDTTVDSVTNKRTRLEGLVKRLGTTDLNEWRAKRNEAIMALRDARQNQITVQLRLADARALMTVYDVRLKALKAPGGKTTDSTKIGDDDIRDAVDAAMERDPEAKPLLEMKTALQFRVNDYVRRAFGEDYISLKSARRQLANVKEQLKDIRSQHTKRIRKLAARRVPLTPGSTVPATGSVEEVEAMRAELSERIKKLRDLDDRLAKDIDTLNEQAAKDPVRAAEADDLAEQIRSEEKMVDNMRHDLGRAKVQLDAASRISNVQDAELMKKEVKKQLLGTMVAPIAVLGAVCAGLALLEHRKRKVHSAGEISRGLGIRVVGAVPRMPHLERHLVGPGGESDLEGTPIMESIDAIRTRLLHEADVRSTRVVMVSSATAGEGKTTLASALATSLARAGRKTLLLDGDLRRPTVHELFEVPMQPGFSEVLLGEIEVAEAAVEAHQENLYVLPAGQWDREVLLALSRDGLEGIFERLAEEFDFIVVDTHPVLSATDALLIGRQSDAVVLAVLREVSQMPRVWSAHQQLTGLGIRVLGAVINGTDPEEVFTSAATPAANAV
jgi:capsular exopolysaccharide synthesis family protein